MIAWSKLGDYTKILKQILDFLEEVPGLAIILLPAVMGKAISVF